MSPEILALTDWIRWSDWLRRVCPGGTPPAGVFRALMTNYRELEAQL